MLRVTLLLPGNTVESGLIATTLLNREIKEGPVTNETVHYQFSGSVAAGKVYVIGIPYIAD